MERNYVTVTLCIDERTCLKGGETAKTRRWRRRRAVRRSRLALYEQSIVSGHRCRSTPSPTPYRRDAKVWRRDQNVDLVLWRPNDLVRSRRQNNGLGLERSFSFNIAAISTESVLRSSLYAYAVCRPQHTTSHDR